ncbi:MAG: hypothetical protein HC853_06945, partial [Anaerolineae bacterium]|nr:hypothetical protein [Anaerolineae bacterium]
MNRLKQQLILYTLLSALTACASFPIGPKRTFNNWEDPTAIPQQTVTAIAVAKITPEAMPTPEATVALPISIPDTQLDEVLDAPTAVPARAEPALVQPTDSSNSSSVDSAAAGNVEYAFPPTTPFTAGNEQTQFGIQINGCDKDVPTALARVSQLGFTWIKQQVRWGSIETAPGVFDWRCLDQVIPRANQAGLKVLLSVTTSPAHTRKIYKGIFSETNGRPADFKNFALFLAYMIQRYHGQIHAIEIWNEPNLINEWGDVIEGSIYAQLLAVGYGITKFMDPNIMVISAGLAPVSFNKQWQAVDDSVFLSQLLDYQGANYADCIGVHANGPDGVGDIQGMSSHYFELTGQSKPMCVTEFGYAVPVEGQAPEGFSWIMTHTPERQSEVLSGG